MIYPMHCTWLNRHIFFNNNTFHQKTNTFFCLQTCQIFPCLSRFPNAALQMAMVCVSFDPYRKRRRDGGVVGGWGGRGGGVSFQKITRLPTSSCSKSLKGAYTINIYVSLSLSVFTKAFAVLYKDLGQWFPWQRSHGGGGPRLIRGGENLKSTLLLIAWREYGGTLIHFYSLDIWF